MKRMRRLTAEINIIKKALENELDRKNSVVINSKNFLFFYFLPASAGA
jgi:hypothetical protein